MRRPTRRGLLAAATAGAAGAAGAAGPARAADPWRDLDTRRIGEIAAWLPERPAGMGPPGADRAAWGHPAIAERLRPLTQAAAPLPGSPFPPWRDEDYLEFSRNGQRMAGERMMEARRWRLYPLLAAECVEWSGRHRAAIEEALLELCRQPSWTLPAHDAALRNLRDRNHDIDLLAAATALDLAQALHLMGDAIDPATRRLVLDTLEHRAFGPLRRTLQTGRGHFWITAPHNWNAVCLGGVVPAALAALSGRAERAVFAAAAEHHIRAYLSGFDAGGYTSEGPSYWNFGVSHFLRLREVLSAATEGRLDLLADAKTRAMALYGTRIEMLPGNVAAFGDAGFGLRVDTLSTAYANEAFGLAPAPRLRDLPVTPTWPFMTSPMANVALLAFATPRPAPAHLVAPAPAERSSLFEEAQVLVSRPGPGGTLAVTIKGGRNGTNHSHDDIGSYAIGVGRDQPVGDPGAPRYTARTFGPDRYAIRAINSWGHPVPRPGGQLQRRAAEVRVAPPEVTLDEAMDSFAIDLAPAYALPGLERLLRRMRHDRRGSGAIRIEDRFSASVPIAFETALVTTGEWRRHGDVLEFRRGAGRLRARLSASAPFDVEASTVAEDGLAFTRIAVVLAGTHRSGFVAAEYEPA
jgi:hypothetical protein